MVQETQNRLIEKAPGDKKPGGDTTSLFVSLYLIILAFFMVLNSISNQSQTKVETATDSVTRAFDNPFAPDTDFIDVTESENSQLPNDEFYEQIRGVFASLIGFDEKFPSEGGNVIRIEFDQSAIYEDESSAFKAEQDEFFKQLATFLKSESIGTVREIEYTVYSGDSFPAGPEYWNNVSILRSGAITEKMTSMGVRQDQLSIGVSPGPVGLLKISFFIRDAVRSRQNLQDADRTGLGEATVSMPGRNF